MHFSEKYLSILHLQNFLTPINIDDISSYSVETLLEIDCRGNRSRNLTSFWHADFMGKGPINYFSYIPTDWKSNLPNTLSKHLWFVMCADLFV